MFVCKINKFAFTTNKQFTCHPNGRTNSQENCATSTGIMDNRCVEEMYEYRYVSMFFFCFGKIGGFRLGLLRGSE